MREAGEGAQEGLALRRIVEGAREGQCLVEAVEAVVDERLVRRLLHREGEGGQHGGPRNVPKGLSDRRVVSGDELAIVRADGGRIGVTLGLLSQCGEHCERGLDERVRLALVPIALLRRKR